MNPLLYLSFFALNFFVKQCVVYGESVPDPILDTLGHQLLVGVQYHILPVVRGRGGGLTLAAPINATTACPLHVVQARQEVSLGMPLTFTPVNTKKGVVRVSTDMNIKFSKPITKCMESAVWRLGAHDETTGQWFVSTGGVMGNPGRETVGNWFKIERDVTGNYYKLVFCPTVCNICKVICKDVGIYIDGKGIRRLALSDDPFKIIFQKL